MGSIGIGVDIQKISKIRETFHSWDGSLMTRIFSREEIEYCRSKSDPFIHLAGRFAAKEAVVKSLSVEKDLGNLVGEVIVLTNKDGAPLCSLGTTLKKVLKEKGGTTVHISISHDDDYAVAFAVSE